MSNEFHGIETLLTSHETPSFSLLAMLAKLMIFNAIKLSMKLSLRLALQDFYCSFPVDIAARGHWFEVGGECGR